MRQAGGEQVEGGSSFYVLGGTVHPGAPSYVARRADEELYAALACGEFCYVLTSRQMGKSSLLVQTRQRLKAAGATVVVLDLTRFGQNATAEQWYRSMVEVIGEQVGLEDEVEAVWGEGLGLSPLARWGEVMRMVVRRLGRVVVLMDEVDVVRSLPFGTDELFAGIRELYNRRVEDEELRGLSFGLFGVARPTDLIRDVRLTPFNIGQRIELEDFRWEEAQVLARGLGGGARGAALLERVLYWTGGHPYLTQRLCAEVFFGEGAAEREDNFHFVRERLLRSEERVEVVLRLYERVLRGKEVRDEAGDGVIEVLKLSGVVKVVGGRLVVRNRVYERVFGLRWVREQLPEGELKRQRAAAEALAEAEKERRRAQEEKQRAEAVLAAVQEALAKVEEEKQRAEAALAAVQEALAKAEKERRQAEAEKQRAEAALRDEAEARAQLLTGRGWEAMEAMGDGSVEGLWQAAAWFWEAYRVREEKGLGRDVRLMAGLRRALVVERLAVKGGVWSVAFAPDGVRLAVGGSTAFDGEVAVWGWRADAVVARRKVNDYWVTSVAFAPDGARLAVGTENGEVAVWDWRADAVVARREVEGGVTSVAFAPDGARLAVGTWYRDDGNDRGEVAVWDWRADAVVARRKVEREVTSVAFAPDGARLAVGTLFGEVAVWDWRADEVVAQRKVNDYWVTSVAFAPDGARLAVGTLFGEVAVWDWRADAVVARRKVNDYWVTSVAFAPDGARLAVGTWYRNDGNDRGEVAVWHWRADAVVARRAVEGGVTSVAFAPDGARLAVGRGYKDADGKYRGEVAVLDTALETRSLTELEPLLKRLPYRYQNGTVVRVTPGEDDNQVKTRAR